LGTPSWALVRFAGSPLHPPAADAPFLFVGTLEPRKNLVRVLGAYEKLLQRCGAETWERVPDLELIGAKGWNDSAIRRKLQNLLSTGKVRVLDYLDRDQLAGRYAAARALLFPSLHEGFGFPILEAMAAGVPVLTSDRGATAEVAGDAALLVDPTSEEAIVAGLERLITESGLSTELATRGKIQVARWTWKRTADLTTAVYDRILRSATSG
jgi:glycosyltransferase involved in cell wall biosynthesis